MRYMTQEQLQVANINKEVEKVAVKLLDLSQLQQELYKREFAKLHRETVEKYGRVVLEALTLINIKEIEDLVKQLQSRGEGIDKLVEVNRQDTPNQRYLNRQRTLREKSVASYVYIRNNKNSIGSYTTLRELPVEIAQSVRGALVLNFKERVGRPKALKIAQEIMQERIEENSLLLRDIMLRGYMDIEFKQVIDLSPEEQSERIELKKELFSLLKEYSSDAYYDLVEEGLESPRKKAPKKSKRKLKEEKEQRKAEFLSIMYARDEQKRKEEEERERQEREKLLQEEEEGVYDLIKEDELEEILAVEGIYHDILLEEAEVEIEDEWGSYKEYDEEFDEKYSYNLYN